MWKEYLILSGRDPQSHASTGRDFDAVVETVLGVSSLEEIGRFYPAMRDRQSRFVDPAGSFSFIARRHVLIDESASG